MCIMELCSIPILIDLTNHAHRYYFLQYGVTEAKTGEEANRKQKTTLSDYFNAQQESVNTEQL